MVNSTVVLVSLGLLGRSLRSYLSRKGSSRPNLELLLRTGSVPVVPRDQGLIPDVMAKPK
jgi:hypothetical protein